MIIFRVISMVASLYLPMVVCFASTTNPDAQRLSLVEMMKNSLISSEPHMVSTLPIEFKDIDQTDPTTVYTGIANTDWYLSRYQSHTNISRGINGGIPCALCTGLMSILIQQAQIHNNSLINSIKNFCRSIPEGYRYLCDMVVFSVSNMPSNFIKSPDIFCYEVELCSIAPGAKMCHLFPLPNMQLGNIVHRRISILEFICDIPGIDIICDLFDNVYNDILPVFDADGDTFSNVGGFRGSIWRGKDCNDNDHDVYPGRRISYDADSHRDTNCNGIYGMNLSSGKTFEEEMCQGSAERGIIYVGDSVGAHFHLPPSWFIASKITVEILSHIPQVMSNEADWPHVSFATGYENVSIPGIMNEKSIDSLYLRLRERNRCNHRNYQNLAKNGATSYSTIRYIESLAMDSQFDVPVILFLSLFGNDVCNEFENSEPNMTTPENFHTNIMKILSLLSKKLPMGSHVILVGLTDGSIIFPAMRHRMHPLGELNQNLRYADLYRWLNCMQIGSCHGWLTSNETLRNLTTSHANKLNAVLLDISREATFGNFDINFMPNPIGEIIRLGWNDGNIWKLIEPVDSFHPNQKAQPLIAKVMWEYITEHYPHVLGPINPMNDQIYKVFGDQGGH